MSITLYGVAAVVSLIVSIVTGAVATNDAIKAGYFGQLRNQASDLIKTLQREFNSKSTSISKALGYLQQGQSNSLINYLSQNPLISNSISELTKAAQALSDKQAYVESLTNRYNSIQQRIANIGYGNTWTEANKSRRELDQLQREEETLRSDLKKAEDDLKNTAVPDSTREISPHTADLVSAVNQNVNGGLK